MKRLFVVLIMVTTMLWVTGCANRKSIQTEPNDDSFRDKMKGVFEEWGLDKTGVYFARMEYDISDDYPPNVQVYYLTYFSPEHRNSLHFYIGFKNDEFMRISIVYREFSESGFRDHRKLLRKDEVSTELKKVLMEIHENYKDGYMKERQSVLDKIRGP